MSSFPPSEKSYFLPASEELFRDVWVSKLHLHIFSVRTPLPGGLVIVHVHVLLTLPYLDFFDVPATAAFSVSAGLFDPAWSFSLNDETCF